MMVAAIKNGTVIDHIPPRKLFKVAAMLRLDMIETRITIGNNLLSNTYGSKGVIKIEDKFFDQEELSRIALLAPHVRLNIIRDYEVVEKSQVNPPEQVLGLVRCPNPKCISNNEPMKTRFKLVDNASCMIRCCYCERKVMNEQIELI